MSMIYATLCWRERGSTFMDKSNANAMLDLPVEIDRTRETLEMEWRNAIYDFLILASSLKF